jgi:hypothetical protein
MMAVDPVTDTWQPVYLNSASELLVDPKPKDYNLEVLKGNVVGSTMVSIIGHDETLTTTRTTLHPNGTTDNIDQTGIHTTPAIVKAASTDVDDSSAGSGCRTLTIIGLDSAGAALTETITLSGQTEVSTSSSFKAVNGARCASWGATGYNEGTIWVGTGTFTSGVPATKHLSLEARSNKAMTAYYTVPAGKTLYLRQLTMNVATSNKDVEFFVEHSTNGGTNWFSEAIFGMEPGAFQGNILAIPGLPAGTHLRIEALSTGAGTDAICLLGCELIDN